MSTKYDREKLIGSGTFGNVWLVRSRCSGLPYVLKEVQLQSMSTTERQQALTEVTVLSTCRHRNIIRYKEASISYEKGILSIVMEYADGGDLYTLIRRQKGCYFDEKDVLNWFVQITFALQYIHSRNILHRDLKSKNIFLTKEKMVKVGDFGIAKVLGGNSELATTAIGTPYYLSPEICQRKPYNHKSDMWALGCVLFEMSALVHPFQAENFHQLVSAILLVKYRSLPSHCSTLVQDLVSVLLHENPEERPFADEVLSIPALLPLVKKYQNISISLAEAGPPDKSYIFKRCSRRFSSNDVLADAKEAEKLKRRASISVGNQESTKATKQCLNKEKVAFTKTRSDSNPRPMPTNAKTGKSSPLANIMNFKNGAILYRKSLPSFVPALTNGGDPNPSAFGTPNATYVLNKKQQQKSGFGSPRTRIESEKGYYSGEANNIRKKGVHLQRSHSMKDKTASQVKSPSDLATVNENSNPEEELICIKSYIYADDIDNVFEKGKMECPGPGILRAISSNESRSPTDVCPHVSQCRQCMVDIMWKNRIRVDSSLHMDQSERSKLRAKLQSVFGIEKFQRIYKTLVTEWEGYGNSSTLQRIFQSLDLEKGQYISLFLQLVQVDMLVKASSVQPMNS